MFPASAAFMAALNRLLGFPPKLPSLTEMVYGSGTARERTSTGRVKVGSCDVTLIAEISCREDTYPGWVAWIQQDRVRVTGSNSILHMNSPFLLVIGPGAEPWMSLQ